MANTLDFLHGAETKEVTTSTGAIQTATSGIIGLLGTAGQGPVNKPTLIAGNPREGAITFGAFGADGFTIPEALWGIFEQIGAVVVAVNVCDPNVHNSQIANEALAFNRSLQATSAKPYISGVTFGAHASAAAPVTAGGNVTLPPGCTFDTIKSADGVTTYVLGTDYTVTNNVATAKAGGAFPAAGVYVLVGYEHNGLVVGVDYTLVPGTGVFTRVPSGKIMANAVLSISYTYVDPTKVQVQDVMGGVAADGSYKGCQAFLGAEDALSLVPRILIAPHFTHHKADAITANPVVADLLGVAQEIKAIIYADGPNTVDEDAIQYRNDWGSDRIMVVDPWAKITGPDGNDWLSPASIFWAGVTAQTDNNVGFWASPSNKEIAGIIGTGRVVDFRLGSTTCRANYLNANQVSTIIRKNGYRTWGNHGTGIDPATTFMNVRRTADMIEDAIQNAMLWAIDRVIDKNFLQQVLEQVGAYLRHLQTVGAIYGGSAWIDRALNTDSVIAGGQVYINYDFTAPKVAERISFIASITDDYISNLFTDLKLSLSNVSILNVNTGGTAS